MPMQVTTTAPLFAATIRPDRSLHTAGGWLGLAVVGLVGGPLLIAAPEMVFPALAAYGAAGAGLFALNLRQARRQRLFQQVTVWPEQLEIVTTDHSNEPHLQRFAPHAVRLRLVRDENERTTGIFLQHGEDALELGAFLASEEKSSFARALGAALRKARKAG